MADLTIDTLSVLGTAAQVDVSVRLTDADGTAQLGYLSSTGAAIPTSYAGNTGADGTLVLDLVPNADIDPPNTYYTVRVGRFSCLIDKSSAAQTLLEALTTTPSALDSAALATHLADTVAEHGRREALLTLGALQSAAEAARVADRQLAVFKDPRAEVIAGVEPTSNIDTPYIGYGIGDTVTVPGIDGTPTVERVRAVNVVEDENGDITFAPELKDKIASLEERHEEALKKMDDGTLRGQSTVATPVTPTAYPAPNCCTPPAPGGIG